MLYISSSRQADFYRPGDPQNRNAAGFQSVHCCVSQYMDKGFLRAVVKGRTMGMYRSQQLFHYHRQPRWRRSRHDMEDVDYWVARFGLKIETDGVNFKATAYVPGVKDSELTKEVVPSLAQVQTRYSRIKVGEKPQVSAMEVKTDRM